MENKQSPSKKKLISIQEEKVPQVECESNPGAAARPSKKQLLDIDILPKITGRQPLQRVLVTINHRTPAVKTIFLAEKSRFYSRTESGKAKSILAFGDHPSFNSRFDEARSSSASPSFCDTDKKQSNHQRAIKSSLNIEQLVDNQSHPEDPPRKLDVCMTKHEPSETCYAHTQPRVISKNHHTLNRNLQKTPNLIKNFSNSIVANTFENKQPPNSIYRLNKRLRLLERRVRRQEMVISAIDNCNSLSSSDEESRENMRSRSGVARPGCSYIEHYSHIPETSAFQRYAQHSAPLSSSRGIEKEHNSEQYGRDFTAYDGITARGRRQCASATCKREDQPKQAAERVIKMRHKLNPVRDYRLMDTVHYLAQGEFAPRNDGIKLTPSREAVLSDIIWEDVCRTHWPSARLGRRQAQERCNTRCELQRLIDSLLRERVAHVERRRRRHYRIVKLNHRHENSAGPVGKTGDIIVASHKHKHPAEDDNLGVKCHNASGAMMTNKRWPDHDSHRCHRSHDRLQSRDCRQHRRLVHDECTPGPSYAVPRSSGRREPTCCYHAAGPSTKPEKLDQATREQVNAKFSSSSTTSSEKTRNRNPRLVVKRRKHHQKKEELNLEHFILLPTLVVRTPSNVKRQKKFNELYHRILNQLSTDQTSTPRTEPADPQRRRGSARKDSATATDR